MGHFFNGWPEKIDLFPKMAKMQIFLGGGGVILLAEVKNFMAKNLFCFVWSRFQGVYTVFKRCVSFSRWAPL